MTTVLAITGLVLGSGAGVTLVTFIVRHATKHQEIDDRLDAGVKRFDKNDRDHSRIEGKVDELGKKTTAVATGLKELLVHFKLREPGQGLNGEDD